jgi:ABC-type Fe3+/spermidine/putrescine transport system ATPase subunit
MRTGRIVQIGTPPEIYQTPADREVAAMFGGANVFHGRVTNGCVASPFGQAKANKVADGAWAEVLYRPASVRVAEQGLAARIVAVRPQAGQLEIEAAIVGSALPEGVEAPTFVRAAAPLKASLTVGAEVKLSASPEEALVFPCRDEICRG